MSKRPIMHLMFDSILVAIYFVAYVSFVFYLLLNGKYILCVPVYFYVCV